MTEELLVSSMTMATAALNLSKPVLDLWNKHKTNKTSIKEAGQETSEEEKENLALVKRIEITVKERYHLTKEVVFDEDGLLRNQDPDARYVYIRISVQNTGTAVITNLQLNRAILAVGDEHSLEDGLDVLFGTEKKEEQKGQQSLNLEPGGEIDIYFVLREELPGEEVESLKDYPALYFIMDVETVEEGRNCKKISLEGVYCEGELARQDSVVL